MCQQSKSSESTVTSGRLVIVAKGFLKLPNLLGSQKLSLQDLANSNPVLNKNKFAIPPLFNSPEVLPSASDKAKLFAENVSKNYNLDASGISLLNFPSKTHPKLYTISVTLKMVKKVILSLVFKWWF